MKNLLAKFYKTLACRVALAIVATATVAKAHDLPQHFPLAPTDWGMIQQDCLGHHSSGYMAIDSLAPSKHRSAEITYAQPDLGNPPEPKSNYSRLASHDLIGPELYDGVDCAQLESYYRNFQSNQQAEELVEYRPQSAPSIVENGATAVVSKFEFHKSFFAACSCDFENRHVNQSILPPKLALQRTYVDDHFANEFNCLKPLLLRDSSRSHLAGNPFQPLAIAIPSARLKSKEKLGKAFSQLASYDCIVRSELYSSRTALELGEFAGSFAKSWFADALPSASHLVADYTNKLKPANKLTTPAPMFVIVQNAAGNEVAIPIAQAKEWEQKPLKSSDSSKAQVAPLSPEFKDLVDSANARLQWAGGRLSAAANFMNDWFSDRMARAKSNDLR